MNESEGLHKKADRLAELADTLRRTTEEISQVLFEQVRVLRYNADLARRSEERKRNADR